MEVSFTAKIMAAGRALESRNPNPLFLDPWAEKLAGPEAMKETMPISEKNEREGKPFASVRTHFFDNFLNNYSDGIRQIVILGSGLDTRAFRLNFSPDTHVYEIDQPNILVYKESVLKEFTPNCKNHLISADLREDFWSQLLIEQGYKTSEPSIWLLEGLVYYLNPTDVEKLMVTINNLSVAGSYLGIDVINTVILNGQDESAKYWQSSCDDPESFLADYGWKASAIQPGETGASFGRFTYKFPDRSVVDAPHLYFVTACKEK